MPAIHHLSCPACGSASIQPVLNVKDELVSGAVYEIWECVDCRLRFTQDAPGEDEIGRFYKSPDYVSHTDEAPGLINRIYRVVRKRTLAGKRRLIKERTGRSKGNLLDIGSGTGAFVNAMADHGWAVTGLEPDPGARKVAEESYGLKLLDAGELYNQPEGSFDAISMWHVLEHVHNLHGYLEKLERLLKNDGKLFIAVPNYTSGDAAIYGEHWAAYDVPRHLYHFSPGSMKKLMEKHGLRLLDEKPMWFDSFYISMLSSKYRKGRISLPSAFINGLRSNIGAMRDVEKCSSVIYIIGKTAPRTIPATISP